MLPGSVPSVSVIIPTRNRAKLVRDCVDSLCVQAFPRERFEIIVADDASTDDTAAVIANLSAAHGSPSIRYLSLPHVGGNGARNAGVAEAAGEILCFVDDDEIAQPNHLKRIVEHLAREPDLDGVGGPALTYYPAQARACPRCQVVRPTHPGAGVRRESWLIGGNMALRKTAFSRRGAFDTRLSSYQEYEWFMRAPALQLLYDPDLWVWHRLDQRPLLERCRTAWRQGTSIPQARARLGVQESPTVRQLLRYLGHATIRLCGNGLVLACRQGGALFGSRIQRLVGRQGLRTGTDGDYVPASRHRTGLQKTHMDLD